MQLQSRSLRELAEMICGNKDSVGEQFPYRSSSYLTQFFEDCEMDYRHKGETRSFWVQEVLEQLNAGPSSSPDLPSTGLLTVIRELMDPIRFERERLDADKALGILNSTLARQGLVAYRDAAGRCHLRNDGTGAMSSTVSNQSRPLSKTELEQRKRVQTLLESLSEDDFTEQVLVPFFQHLGFRRVSAAGHREKSLEFGKDLWMKWQLPTGHWIYFGAQVKRGKIDAGRGSGGGNVSEVLTQARMAIGHPVSDPDLNRDVLVDHVYIIASGEITRQARLWLASNLEQEKRRHIIFMDQAEFLDQAARILAIAKPSREDGVPSEDIPF